MSRTPFATLLLALPLLIEPTSDSAAAAAISGPGPQGRATLVVRASALHLGDGRVLEQGELAISGGRIQAVGTSLPVPQGAQVLEHDGPISAGFVLPYTHWVPRGEAFDATRTALPEARLATAFRPSWPELADALEAGITAVVLAPTPQNVVGGQAALVKTGGGRVVSARSHLALSFSRLAADDQRPPTSHAGIVRLLERHSAEQQGVFKEVAERKLPLLLAAEDRHEVLRAVDLAKRIGAEGALVGAPLAGELLAMIEASGLGVIARTPGLGTGRRNREAFAALGRSEVPFAFAQAEEHELRLGWMALLRAGVPRERIEQALMSNAARLAGAAGRLGTLERGADADFVLWSGDPLEPGSRPVAVYIDGKLVHGGTR